MIMAWLTARGIAGLAKGWWLLILIAALASCIIWLRVDENVDDKNNQQLGAKAERVETQAATLEQVRKANEAVQTIRRDADASRDECMRNARNPENC